MSTAEEERDWWEIKAADLDTARAAIWDETEPNFERIAKMLDQIVPALYPVLFNDARVLDLGCGVGDITRAMARRYPAVKFIGVDVSPAMLNLARSLSLTNTRWVWGDGRTLPRVGQLNGAWSVLTFQHIPAEAQAGYIREVADRLEPGGIFCFQWVTCSDAAFLTNGASEGDIRTWCEDAGLKVDTVRHGDRCESWAWCKAVKP